MGIKGKLREVLYIKETPHHLALSFSVGVFIAICPLLGLHTLLAVAACFLYRFNKFALFVGVYITNPWTIIPIYTFCMWVGAHLTGVELGAIDVDWANMRFMTILEDLEALVLPFFVGSTLVSVVAALLSYPLFRSAVVKTQLSRQTLEAAGTGKGGEVR
jgi:uncharacterized protein (DUF2062 family)